MTIVVIAIFAILTILAVMGIYALMLMQKVAKRDAVSLVSKDFTAATAEKKRKIKDVIEVFENGKIGNYGGISIYNDGPNEMPQVTYGKSQTTEASGLRLLLQKYCTTEGAKYGDDILPFLSQINTGKLHKEQKFLDLLTLAGKNDPIMWQVQDEFFDSYYFVPAYKFGEKNGFSTNLGLLVLYDSYVHSGGILWTIRQMFSANMPPKGDEKAWVRAYVKARREWLSEHRLSVLHFTVYRMKCLQELIDKEDWNLDTVINANGIKIKSFRKPLTLKDKFYIEEKTKN